MTDCSYSCGNVGGDELINDTPEDVLGLVKIGYLLWLGLVSWRGGVVLHFLDDGIVSDDGLAAGDDHGLLSNDGCSTFRSTINSSSPS